ncbi:hypothetical protein P4475_11270 [Halalkalibacterium halodurans]|jgi:hypothetical protein|uniref:BH2217 protein n=2 Tax=Halalkalibacterium halodurans TaxID=86665 RepID=Q9KAS0_HALH5|nr:hypothetical protein [Halalkalibacterium halodurans]MDY7222770.1 hypothetical protein [Halalkalibacterium halodurans]MDY7241991.1 hypothetical protein [Halalkalibacterium halodurans]MED3647365.1 hypothetical protein [Halalkalibacterium halodurans]MED4123687.1 hypothetical protein [Halalkalibacterium halodurans]MED4162617.1 hypothetical protein [Halalkalibacterium halodurans]
MIDLNFERYTEATLTNFAIVRTYEIQHWTHVVVSFQCDAMPEDIIDPEALLILSESGDVLQVVLYEEGCDSPNYQFTELEKEQLIRWFRASS